MVSNEIMMAVEEIGKKLIDVALENDLQISVSAHDTGAMFVDFSDKPARKKAGDSVFKMICYYIDADGKKFTMFENEYLMEGEDDGE